MTVGLNKFPHDKYIAMCMIGWAVGKLAAVNQGADAVKVRRVPLRCDVWASHASRLCVFRVWQSFARLNCIPLVLWLVTNFRGGAALTTSILPAALLGGYFYAAFIED